MNPQKVIHWLNVCATDCHAEECKKCPYNKDDYEAGCGKLLADAALLLSAAYGKEADSISIGPGGVEVKFK